MLNINVRYKNAFEDITFILIMSFFKLIPTSETGVVQRFGKLVRLARPGLRFYIPFIEKINLVSNRLAENQCTIQIRTADKVFPKLDISIQYKVKPEDAGKAYFELSDPVAQMISYTDNTVRRKAATLTLDELFQSQSEIADSIIKDVGPKMLEGGFTIESAQVRNIMPPQDVLKSMNQINASERRRIAAQNDGEAAKIKAVLLAEADAQEKALRGKGVAEMRNNITQGWSHSISQMAKQTGIPAEKTMDFLFKILQQQTMETMSKNAGTKVIFVDKQASMNSGKDLKEQIMQSLEGYDFKADETLKR